MAAGTPVKGEVKGAKMLYAGLATGGTLSAITIGGVAGGLAASALLGYQVNIIAGTGSGQTGTVLTHTVAASVATLGVAPWAVAPDTTSRYEIRLLSNAEAAGNGILIRTEGLTYITTQLTGTFVATFTFEATIDGTTWVALPTRNRATGTVATTATVTGVFDTPVLGMEAFRVRVSAYTSGTPTAYSVGFYGSLPPLLATDAAGDLTSVPGQVTYTDRSGTITTGGTSQQLMAANTARKYWYFQNLSTGNLYLDFGVAAVQGQPSRLVLPNAGTDSSGAPVTTQAINVIGAATGQSFSGKEG